MKIDWDEAPEWANYVARDADGEWYWYENKPKESGSGHYFYAQGRILLYKEDESIGIVVPRPSDL